MEKIKNFKDQKRNLLYKVKNSLYSDEMNSHWLNIFDDDTISFKIIESIKNVNIEWEKQKKEGTTVKMFVDYIYDSYHKNYGKLTADIIAPIMFCACEEIKTEWYTRDIMKNMKITCIDMSGN